MGELKPYPEYKDSNLPWLGKIPKHWELRKMKYLFSERKQKGFPNESLLAATQTKGVVPKELFETRTVVAQKDLHLLKLVKKGDYVISLRSFQGGIELAHYQGIISPAYTVLEPESDTIEGYYKPLFKSKLFVDQLKLFVTGIREGQNIDYERLGRSFLPLPPTHEQNAIGDYLKTLELSINRYISAKFHFIEYLDEQKQAITSKAVMRGLDPNVRFNSSGIDWLGEVPENWEIIKMKYFFNERIEKGYPNEPLLAATQVKGVVPKSLYEHRTVLALKNLHQLKLVKEGDFVISLRSFQGGIEYAYYRGIISSAYTILRPKNAANSDYFRLLFKTHNFIENLSFFVTGIREGQNIDYQKLKQIFLPLPSFKERCAIAQYIEAVTKNLDHQISTTQREIELLKEYRTRLISDIVSGRLDIHSENNYDISIAGLDESSDVFICDNTFRSEEDH